MFRPKNIILFAAIIFAPYLFSQNNTAVLTPEMFDENREVLLLNDWKFNRTDKSAWKIKDLDDSSWRLIASSLSPEDAKSLNWDSFGWFRKIIIVDSALINKVLGISFWHAGASEMYLNGKLLFIVGKVGLTKEEETHFIYRDPIPLIFKERENLFAVRFSNHSWQHFASLDFHSGFTIRLGNITHLIEQRSEKVRSASLYQTVFIVVPLVLTILHFFLFIFNPKLRQNLYYILFLLFFVLFIYINTNPVFSTSQQDIIFFYRLGFQSLLFTILFGAISVYSIFEEPGKFFLWSFIVGLILSIIMFIAPHKVLIITTYAFITIVSSFAMTKVFTPSKVEGRWIIKAGFVLMSIAGIYQMFISLNIIAPIAGIDESWTFGVLTFIVSMSIWLARDYAAANKKLEIQIKQIRELSEKTIEQERINKEIEIKQMLLEADNFRKTVELEDARKLQISMLPKSIPQLPHLDIEAMMETATEVGGDFYDFILREEKLIIAMGDATGHGSKAGIMVAIFKSLFNAEKTYNNFPDFFNRCTEIIKRMNLGNLFMSSLILSIENYKLKLSSAGMPPILIGRSSSKLEEIKIKSMPLGAFSNYEYDEQEIEVYPGDTILLMTDGLPELFNKKNEMYEYSEVKNVFMDCLQKPALEIIKRLKFEALRWRGSHPQSDDITFIVIKVK